ncbi:MAG: hypothetical protein WAU82_06300 [Candidatus Binatus sp.]|uniref:hypothetical protein n=1 Tax=Candidatus Binatus sp. TaxID=2811406 RepID=UPI003BB12B27
MAMKPSPFSENPAWFLAFQAKVFHVKRFLVQENETGIAEAVPFDKVSGHSLMAMTEGLYSILPA